MSERDLALLQAPLLDGPDGSSVAAKSLNRRFRDELGLQESPRRDIDLGLLAKVKIVRQVIERDLDPALLVNSVAFRFNSGNPAMKSLGRYGSQDDLGGFANPDFAGLAFINIGQHPYRVRIDQSEDRVSRGKRRPELLRSRDDHGIVRSG